MFDSDGTEHDGVTLQSVIDKIPTANVAPRAEVIDEFARELKDQLDDTYSTGEDALIDINDLIDHIAQKMKGCEPPRAEVIEVSYVLYLLEYYGGMLTWSKEDILSEIKRRITKEGEKNG
jgi:hypothetical protein